MSGWNGDISKMGQLANRIADLAKVPSRASRRVAVAITRLMYEQFDVGADPYGNTYAPLEESTLAKRSQTTEPPLTDFGNMRRSLEVRPMASAGVSVTIDHPAEDHQTGWSGPVGAGPARPILPYGVMPERWAEAIEAEVTAEVKKTVAA